MFPINTIFYSKDGRRCGNLTVVGSYEVTFPNDLQPVTATRYICMTDYGNEVRVWEKNLLNPKYFYKRTGLATPTHKYYNYLSTIESSL